MKTGPKEIDSAQSRTELVHLSLKLAQDSGLAEERELRTIVHTRENKIFRFEGDASIPSRLENFENLIVQTVQGHEPPMGIEFQENTLMQALKDEVGHKVVLSPKGEKKDPTEFFSRAEDYVVVIGGFPEGDFVSPVYKWAENVISISERLMKPWSVTSEILVGYRYCSLE